MCKRTRHRNTGTKSQPRDVSEWSDSVQSATLPESKDSDGQVIGVTTPQNLF